MLFQFLAYLQGIETDMPFLLPPCLTPFLAYLQGIETLLLQGYSVP